MSEIMTPPTKIVVGDVEYEAFHDGQLTPEYGGRLTTAKGCADE